MFSFNLSFLAMGLDALEQTTLNEPKTLYADICLPETFKKLGNMSISYSTEETLAKSHEMEVKSPVKRKQVPKLTQLNSKKLNPTSSSKPQLSPAPDHNLLLTQVKPESLINITQNLTTGEKTFQCSMCGYTSNQKGAVKRHIELKHVPKQSVYKCQICDYTSKLRFPLKTHYTTKHSMPEEAAKKMMSD